MKAFLMLLLVPAISAAEPLFDGESFKGWKIREGEEEWWTIKDGSIIGGSLERRIPHNTFITTGRRYGDFELRLKVKLEGKNGNAGIQIRSERIRNHHEMIGYQADIGREYWGKLYDESRRRKIIGDHVSEEAAKAVRKGWNDYRIRCEGPRIRLWLNGILTVDFTEKEDEIALRGLIGLQAHSGGPFLIYYKDIVIEELP